MTTEHVHRLVVIDGLMSRSGSSPSDIVREIADSCDGA
jgi:hypothetical protein